MHYHIFKETVGITTEEKVDFIDTYRDVHSLAILLRVAMLSKSSYFEFKNRKVSDQEKRKFNVSKSIREIWLNSNKIYGARKIKAMLEFEGIDISERTVGNYMKDMDIASVYRRKYRPASSKKTKNEDLPNNTKDVHIERPHHYIATDITYIHTKQDGWVYQITFIDLYTRKVLHYGVSKKMDDEFVSSNTEMVLKKYKDIRIIHSDRGSQYTSNRYMNLLKQYSVLSSYSKPGYPYDNAIIESYHASIKIEWLYRHRFQTIEDVNKAVFKYNYGFYNTKRIHQSLGYLTPNQAESNYKELNYK